MKKVILFCLITFLYTSIKAQSVITVQHGSTTLLANTLDSAIIKAQDGDYIYLPGGLVASSANIVITKKLFIIGAGYNPDSSAATSISNISCNVTFNPGSEGSLITGVSSGTYTNIIIGTSNITVTRTNMYSIVITPANASDILIEENILRSDFIGYGSNQQILSNVIFRKNLCYGNLSSMYNTQNITCTNNIFFGNYFATYNCIFQNNIFANANININGNVNTYTNNLYVTASPNYTSGSYVTGEITNQDVSGIFINYIAGTFWTPKQNFHLKSTSAGKGKGTDGKDVGLYGTTSPFKDGGMPFNPHLQTATIANTTDATGKLNIKITVKAQGN